MLQVLAVEHAASMVDLDAVDGQRAAVVVGAEDAVPRAVVDMAVADGDVVGLVADADFAAAGDIDVFEHIVMRTTEGNCDRSAVDFRTLPADTDAADGDWRSRQPGALEFDRRITLVAIDLDDVAGTQQIRDLGEFGVGTSRSHPEKGGRAHVVAGADQEVCHRVAAVIQVDPVDVIDGHRRAGADFDLVVVGEHDRRIDPGTTVDAELRTTIGLVQRQRSGDIHQPQAGGGHQRAGILSVGAGEVERGLHALLHTSHVRHGLEAIAEHRILSMGANSST